MRESNFAFPAQNRACVCITSQLYDRRALDTNSPLPLFNSLTHLTYLTSTSPRIREIMTMDGGLERLVRILHDFCMCPPPPENPSALYGLSPPSSHPSQLVPTLNPKSFDKHAAYRFSLAFQCVVNIGVRGSEPIRSRVVQAGTLEVVGCILEAWLAGKGFAVGPSASASGMPRETREQRTARREARQREQAAQLAIALQREVATERIRPERVIAITPEDESMETEPATSETRRPGSRDTDTSTETSSNATPLGSNTPTGSVMVPSRDRSGTIIARPVWDQAPAAGTSMGHHRRNLRTASSRLAVPPPSSEGASTSNSTDTSRPETETEDDGDVDMEDSVRESDARSMSGASTPERRDPSPDPATAATIRTAHSRRAVGIVSDTTPNTQGGVSLEMNTDAHIIINDQAVGVDGVGGVEDGIVSLDTNDDFAMGAPPGAPGAIDGLPGVDPHAPGGERTPRAGTVNLPGAIPIVSVPTATTIRVTGPPGEGAGPGPLTAAARMARANAAAGVAGTNGTPGRHHHHHHHTHDMDSGPYRDEDVLLSLQLLAYLSKYPHVRQSFYKQRTTFHPASAQQQPSDVRYPGPSRMPASASTSASGSNAQSVKETNPFLKAFATATGRGKEKEKAAAPSMTSSSSASSTATVTPPRMTNVFSLVERFTFRPSSSELDSLNPPPTLPPEIQYWAGVIMRNACRKDDTRGGIRQCANMMCGKWESFPREFAKCRRCRKAKYCGKECQSTAWSEGHRFWCSAKEPDEDGDHHVQGGEGTRARSSTATGATTNGGASGSNHVTVTSGGTVVGRAERRAERDRERQARASAAEARLQDQAAGGSFTNALRTATSPLAVNPNTTLAALNNAQTGGVPYRVDREGRQAPEEEPVNGLNWAALRRQRVRPDGVVPIRDAATEGRAIIDRAVQFMSPRRRPVEAQTPGAGPAPSIDVELPADVRRQLTQMLRREREPESGPSRLQEQRTATGTIRAPVRRLRQDGDDDDDMVLG